MRGGTLQSTFQAAELAGQILPFPPPRDCSEAAEQFLDNLDHLQALEQEAKLMLALAQLRRGPSGEAAQDALDQVPDRFPFLPAAATAAQVEELLAGCAKENRRREVQTRLQGGGCFSASFATSTHWLPSSGPPCCSF